MVVRRVFAEVGAPDGIAEASDGLNCAQGRGKTTRLIVAVESKAAGQTKLQSTGCDRS